MADKAISELVAAQSVMPTDLFVLEQNGTAKKLTGQVLENWLLSFAEGHGGIQSCGLLETVGLVKTYRFTLADQTYMDIDVVDGRGIESLVPTSTNGLVVTYTVTYNDGTTSTFTVTNGEKGDKGDTANLWIKYASKQPTADSHNFGDVPDAWIGISSGHLTEAPTDWQQYQWFQWKGEKGDKGDPATLLSSSVTYQAGDSGTIIPSGSWSTSIPTVAQGKYLWTKTVKQFNTGDPITAYSVSRMGIDGLGSVVSVAGISPDADGNVPLTAEDVKALPLGGGMMEGGINMNGKKLFGLNAPTEDTEAATKGYTLGLVKMAAPLNLLDNSDFTNPVNQRGFVSGSEVPAYAYFLDRWNNNTNGNRILTLSKSGVGMASEITISQHISGVSDGTVVTVACKLSDGTILCRSGIVSYVSDGSWYRCITATDSNIKASLFADTYAGLLQFNVYSYTDIIIEWVALYEGEYTAETLPNYIPKGYAAELAECQRYYVRIDTGDYTAIGIGHVNTTNQVVGAIALPQVMRLTHPSINLNGTLMFRSVNLYYDVAAVSLNSGGVGTISLWLDFADINVLTPGCGGDIFIQPNGYLEISADL